jgi:CheY-like chemotaxis protein
MYTKENEIKSKPQLLIIENNFICQHIYFEELRHDYHIEFASTAEETLKRLVKQTYHCIISDLGLPDKPGIELLPIIRNSALNKDVPIIIISAYMSRKLKQTCLELGAKAVYVKPIDPILLRKIIEKRSWD